MIPCLPARADTVAAGGASKPRGSLVRRPPGMLRIFRPVNLILAAVLISAACSGGDVDLEAVTPEVVSEATISDGDQPTVTATTTPTTTTVLAFSLDALNPAMDAGGVMTLLGDLACGLRADGGIKCWGTLPYFTGGLNNTWHQPSDSYIALSGSCGLRPDQTIRCWNGFDPPAGRFIAISHEGSWHACGIRVDQTVECWGDDEVESGRIGRCPAEARPCHNQGQNGYDQATAPEGTFTAVATGWWHSCGLRTDQTIECWGGSDLADGYPRQVEPPEGTFTAIASGHLHSCGVRTDQTIDCWGSNQQLWIHVRSGRPPGRHLHSRHSWRGLSPVGYGPTRRSNAGENTPPQTPGLCTKRFHRRAGSPRSSPEATTRAASEPTRPSNAGGLTIRSPCSRREAEAAAARNCSGSGLWHS